VENFTHLGENNRRLVSNSRVSARDDHDFPREIILQRLERLLGLEEGRTSEVTVAFKAETERAEPRHLKEIQ
jgi:gluconate kinase